MGGRFKRKRIYVYLWLIHVEVWQKTMNFCKAIQFSSFRFSLSLMSDSATPWTTARQASLSITNSRSSLRLTSIESVMPSSHLILCCPLLLLPSIFLSIRVFSNESDLRIRWPKCWSFSFNISPSNEHQGLISFRMDWLDLLAVQGTLKSLLQHHSSKASILWISAFFIVQLSHGQVWFLVWEDSTCCGQLSPCTTTEARALEPVLCNKRSHCNAKPAHHNEE